MSTRELHCAARFVISCGVLTCLGTLPMFSQDVEQTHLVNRLIGGVLFIIASSLIRQGDVWCNCRPPLLLFNVYVILCAAITCYIMSFVGAIVWTLPWWSELYEWVSGLVAYGLVTDVLSVIAGALLLIVICRQSRAIRNRESDLARRQQATGRDIVRSSAR